MFVVLAQLMGTSHHLSLCDPLHEVVDLSAHHVQFEHFFKTASPLLC